MYTISDNNSMNYSAHDPACCMLLNTKHTQVPANSKMDFFFTMHVGICRFLPHILINGGSRFMIPYHKDSDHYDCHS